MFEISMLIIAIAFTFLVIYLIIVLRSAQKTLNQLTDTLQTVKLNMNDLGNETRQLLHQANILTSAIEPFSQATHLLGKVALEKSEEVYTSMRKASPNSTNDEKALTCSGAVLDWVLSGAELWNTFRNSRNKK